METPGPTLPRALRRALGMVFPLGVALAAVSTSLDWRDFPIGLDFTGDGLGGVARWALVMLGLLRTFSDGQCSHLSLRGANDHRPSS
jgi:hypothetical protein